MDDIQCQSNMDHADWNDNPEGNNTEDVVDTTQEFLVTEYPNENGNDAIVVVFIGGGGRRRFLDPTRSASQDR
jgi:hypothetical protein